jgi:hypothetical protein
MKEIVILVALLFPGPEALACGACAGDRAAAVYSYENMMRAEGTGGSYVVAGVSGFTRADQERAVVRALEASDCVEGGTVRAAAPQSAVSLVLRKGCAFEKVVDGFGEAMAPLRLELLERH